MRTSTVLRLCLVMSLVLAAGCGSRKSAGPPAAKVAPPQASSAEQPAPGAMKTVSVAPVALESRWVWKDAWVSAKDLGHCTLTAYGMDQDAKSKGEFAVTDLDHCIVLAFENEVFAAEQCSAVRVHLPKSEYAGLWWAADADIQADAYPFSLDRFMPMRKLEGGVFEADFAGEGNRPPWQGTIRLLRIDPYLKPGDAVTFQRLEGNFVRTSGWAKAEPPKVKLQPDNLEHALGLLARCKATRAIEDIEALGTRWYYSPWYATEDLRAAFKEVGRDRGAELLGAGDVKGALRVFSAAGRGSGHFVDYLYELRDALSEAQRTALWPDAPFLVVDDFSSSESKAFVKIVESQGRKVTKTEKVDSVSRTGSRSVFLEVSEGTQEGRSEYGIPTHIGISEKPFAVRFDVRDDPPSKIGAVYAVFYPGPGKTATGAEATSQPLEDNWKRFDFCQACNKQEYAKGQGYDLSGSEISLVGIGLPQGPASKVWLDRVEVYLIP